MNDLEKVFHDKLPGGIWISLLIAALFALCAFLIAYYFE
jgi:hypothetical protein